jgi:DNA-directed RNA polymerase specialized sigma24 family protein
MTPEALRQRLSDPELLRGLSYFVGSRLPESEARDVAQATILEALGARTLPEETAVKGWLYGIARHKIADHYRHRKEQVPLDHEQLQASNEPAEANVVELLHWVDREVPQGADARRTLDWMMREADGDPLEAIAEEHRLPAPTVRQRVSRLRRHLRERWSLQLASAVLGLVVVVTGYAWYESRQRVAVLPEMTNAPKPSQPAGVLRRQAIELCALGRFEACMKTLEDAKRLDPDGDGAPEVQAARRQIEAARAAAATRNSVPAPISTDQALRERPASSAPIPTNTSLVPHRERAPKVDRGLRESQPTTTESDGKARGSGSNLK